MSEAKKSLYQLIYQTLIDEKLTSTAKAFAKEATIDKKAPLPSESLMTIYNQYLEQKKQQVSKEESSESESSSSSESESEDEKPIAQPPATKAKKVESSSESDSDSEDEKPVAKKAAPAPVPPAKKATPAAKKAESSDSDSSSESDSDSEDEKPVAKKAAPAPPAKKATPATKKAESSDSDSSSESDSDSEEEAPPAKVAGNKRKAEISDESSDSDSESEEEKPVVKAPATPSKKVEPPAKKQKADSTPAKAAGEHLAFVRGLPWTAAEEEIRSFFGNAKEIETIELPLDDTGRSSGTAIVSFASRSALDAALSKDGQTLPNSERWLKITEGKPARKSVGSAPDSTTKPAGCDTVFVGNLPWDVDEAQMYELFGQCGEVAKVRFATSAEDGSFKGFAHVQFSSADSVDAAVQLYGTDLNGRSIRVDYAPPKNRESLGGGRGEGGRGRGEGRGRGDGGRGRGRGRGTPTTGNKNKGTIASNAQGKKISFDE